MAYKKTEWLPYETLVSADNMNKIEDQLEIITTITNMNELVIESMGDEVGKLSSSVESIEGNIGGVLESINEVSNQLSSMESKLESQSNLSMIKSEKDEEGIFKVVTYKRKADNTIYCVSKLSGGTSPQYTTRTEEFYDATGSSVINTITYTLSYDKEGNLISEV